MIMKGLNMMFVNMQLELAWLQVQLRLHHVLT